MLVIYDITGYIYLQGEGFPEPKGIPFLNLTIPDGKQLVSIDVSKEPHEAIYSDIPKNQMELLQDAVRELSNKSNDGSFNSPIVWVNGMVAKLNLYYTGGGKKYQCIEDSIIGLWGEPQYLARYFKEVN